MSINETEPLFCTFDCTRSGMAGEGICDRPATSGVRDRHRPNAAYPRCDEHCGQVAIGVTGEVAGLDEVTLPAQT